VFTFAKANGVYNDEFFILLSVFEMKPAVHAQCSGLKLEKADSHAYPLIKMLATVDFPDPVLPNNK